MHFVPDVYVVVFILLRMEMPLRGRSGGAHRRRPYAFCLRELRADVRPYGFVWVDCMWTVGGVGGGLHADV